MLNCELHWIKEHWTQLKQIIWRQPDPICLYWPSRGILYPQERHQGRTVNMARIILLLTRNYVDMKRWSTQNVKNYELILPMDQYCDGVMFLPMQDQFPTNIAKDKDFKSTIPGFHHWSRWRTVHHTKL